MFRYWLFSLFLLCASAVNAQSPLVISVQPVYLIAKEITKGVEEPRLLLENQNGHDVSLTPAHRKLLQDASLVIWLGKAHEAPLESVLAQNNSAVSILNSGILQTMPLRNSRGQLLKDTIDTHVWLEPNNAVRIGFFIAALRSQQYPQHKTAYWNNAQAFAKAMHKASQTVRVQGGVKPYWAFHDAYQYLERSIALKFAGSFTEDPHVAPTIGQIKYLSDHRPMTTMCVLAESHASANQFQKLGSVHFQQVDESFAQERNFITAWQKLATETRSCVQKTQK